MPRHVPLENEKERTSDAEAPGDGRAGHPTRPQGQGGGPKKKEQSCGECCTAWFMMLLLVVRILTVLAAALVVVAHILILVELPLGLDVWEIWARRLYGIGLCVLVMLLHVRCVGILEHWSALKNWAMRGLFYTLYVRACVRGQEREKSCALLHFSNNVLGASKRHSHN